MISVNTLFQLRQGTAGSRPVLPGLSRAIWYERMRPPLSRLRSQDLAGEPTAGDCWPEARRRDIVVNATRIPDKGAVVQGKSKSESKDKLLV